MGRAKFERTKPGVTIGTILRLTIGQTEHGPVFGTLVVSIESAVYARPSKVDIFTAGSAIGIM